MSWRRVDQRLTPPEVGLGIRLRIVLVVDGPDLVRLDRGLLVEHVEHIEGCIVECGVARGGCAGMMGLLSDKELWLFDSFEGLPAPTEEDEYKPMKLPQDKSSMVVSEGYCYGSLSEVDGLLYYKLYLSPFKTNIIKGRTFFFTGKQVGPFEIFIIRCQELSIHRVENYGWMTDIVWGLVKLCGPGEVFSSIV